MGDWNRNANWDRDVLERIAVLLFALANLADLAAGAPFLRRRQVLAILNRGEAEAWAFVMGLPPVEPVSVDVAERAGEAARLAASFRALALMLCALLARSALLTLAGTVGSQARWRAQGISGSAACQPVVSAPPAPDTS